MTLRRGRTGGGDWESLGNDIAVADDGEDTGLMDNASETGGGLIGTSSDVFMGR